MDVYEFFENAQKVNENWMIDRLKLFIFENERLVIDMIQSQWERSQNEEGKIVGRYKPITELFYAKVNPPISGMPKKSGEPYNMIWDGDLIKLTNIDFEIKNNEFILLVDSTAPSKDGLFSHIRRERYIDEPYSIFGLQEINMGKLSDLTEENLIEKFIQTLKIE